MTIHRAVHDSANRWNARVYLVIGDASELVWHAVQLLERAGLKHCGIPSFNHWSGSAREGGVTAALGMARTVPMMADCRVIVLRDVHQAKDAELEALVEYLGNPVDTTVLIVSAGKFPAVRKGGINWSRKIQSCVDKVGERFVYKSDQIRPQAFAMDHARGLEKTLGSREANVLVSSVGGDLSTLAREVEKLALFVGENQRITAEDIGKACAILAEEGLWELTGGLAESNSERALRALYRRLEEGAAPHQLLGQVCWQVRTLLVAKEAMNSGMPESVIQKKHRVRAATLKSLRRPSAERFGAPNIVMAQLARANRSMNEHRAGGRKILEALILDLCS